MLLLSIDPLIIAQQLCLVEQNKFKSIEYTEFEKQGWNKKDAETRSPNIVALIRHFNRYTCMHPILFFIT
jgi:hypothetical protein